MDWLLSAIGVVVVLGVLLDIFHTLANPGAQGFVSRTMLQSIWRWSRHSRLSGPLAMLAVIVIWGVLAVVGWALIYWPHLPEGFSSFHPAQTDGGAFLDALYISLVTISTLGFGDVFPTSDWLRLVNPVEALFGFALLTVAVSWVLQVYPALSRRKVLAIRLALLSRGDCVAAMATFDGPGAARILDDLCTAVVNIRVDLADYPETYYFRVGEESDSLARNLGYAAELGRAGAASTHPEVRHAGELLLRSLDDIAAVLDAKFLHTGEGTAKILAAYAAEHHSGTRPASTPGLFSS